MPPKSLSPPGQSRLSPRTWELLLIEPTVHLDLQSMLCRTWAASRRRKGVDKKSERTDRHPGMGSSLIKSAERARESTVQTYIAYLVQLAHNTATCTWPPSCRVCLRSPRT